MARNNFNLAEYYKMEELKSLDSADLRERLALEPLVLVYWKDHIAELADVRAEVDVGKDKDGNPLIQHIRNDGIIFQEGTPVNAEHLGQMEYNDLINFTRIGMLEDVIKALQVQVATLIGQNQNNMPYNSFVASFKGDVSGLEVIEGWYDEINERVVLNG